MDHLLLEALMGLQKWLTVFIKREKIDEDSDSGYRICRA